MRVTHYREQDAVHHFQMTQTQDASRVPYNAMEKFIDATAARKADLIKKGVVDPSLLVPKQEEVKATKNAKKLKEMKTEVNEIREKEKEKKVANHDNISPTPTS